MGAKVATATQKQETAEAVVPKMWTFRSKHAELCLVREPLIRTVEATGIQRTVNELTAIRCKFRGGVLVVTEDVRVAPVPGLVPNRVMPDGVLGAEQDMLTWLRSHPDFNSRFHEDGNEPDRPLPTDDQFLEAVNDAAFRLDEEAITAMLAQERETHNRPVLVKAADDQRKRVIRMKQLQAEQVEEG